MLKVLYVKMVATSGGVVLVNQNYIPVAGAP